MSDLSWYFRKKQKNEMSVDPMDAEFFVENDDSSKLVREAIQNSLDARLEKDKPIKFRLQLIREQKISSDNKNWIDCAILIPDLTRHTETAEVISGSFLRESLPCKDGDKLEIKLY